MSPKRRASLKPADSNFDGEYAIVLNEIATTLESVHRQVARAINTLMTATYWRIGKRIFEFEQGGTDRAEYGAALVKRLAADLSKRFGRGFALRNLNYMRQFYRLWPVSETSTLPVESELVDASPEFPLPWSHYVRLVSIASADARKFYETEAIRGGWSLRQLDRQINSQFYERTLLSRNKAAMLRRGSQPTLDDFVTPEEEIKDPFVLEFLDLRDEYSENDLEEALVENLQEFLLELGDDFAFVARQRKLRIGNQWFRVDLLFFHRRLRCLVVVDLKIGEFTHADAGQMHLYLNFARENWVRPDENPPVGLILCASKDETVARYALDGLPNKVMAAEYRLTLPDEQTLSEELRRSQRILDARRKDENE